MGIPSFYRWLADRYPLSVVDVLEETLTVVNGVELPADSSLPNPNGLEFDNLYIDMNGIIHPCFHPEDQVAPTSYEDVFKAVFRYLDRIFSIVRPRQLLYMAIDGVAPRAKMNQQRARRFRAAKDAADAAAEDEKQNKNSQSGGENLSVCESKALDSNVITPGTEFMASLSDNLQYYIHLKLNQDPGWRNVKVILSDANVPGEGEHKIMSYIRLQRNLPGFNPNTRHCLYGLDADLIMLALATHEVHFSILREDIRQVYTSDKDPKSKKGSRGVGRDRKHGLKSGNVGSEDLNGYISEQKFQFLNIWVLRDYLMHDMAMPDTDLERLIDDFVFMCIFIGNDFLPHVPSLEISEGAIDLLMTVYKEEFVRMGGYLTNSFEVNLKHVEHFIQVVGSHENAIFRRRREVQREREIKFQRFSNKNYGGTETAEKTFHLDKRQKQMSFWSSFDHMPSPSSKEGQSPVNSATPDSTNSLTDNIKLGEEGWKERFYAEKFEVNTKDEHEQIQRNAVLKYIEGICWVMRYYYHGVCSWQWFYPYHYAPFASDFCGLERLEIHFTLGEPFKPFDQLMGVLPAASAHALPLFYRKLMTDPESPILDFYPADFELDMNGKRFSWQAICKLPFIKETRLLTEIAKVEHTLTDEEKQRNSLGLDILFVHIKHDLSVKILSFYKRNTDHPKLSSGKVKRKIDPKFSGGMNGFMYISDKPVCPPEINSPLGDMETITSNQVISVLYRYPPAHPHIPRPPEGVSVPKRSVRKSDILPAPVLWHEKFNFFERVRSERSVVHKCISGSTLAKLSHQLVLKYYPENKQSTVGPARLDTSIGYTSCLLNLEDVIHEKEVKDDKTSSIFGPKPGEKLEDTGNRHSVKGQSNSTKSVQEKEVNDNKKCMNGIKLGKRKRKRINAKRNKKCKLNLQEIIHEKELDREERKCLNDTKSRKRKDSDADVAWSIEHQSNMEKMVHNTEAVKGERCLNERNAQKRLRDSGDDKSIKRRNKKRRRKSRGSALERPVLAC